MEIVRLTTQSFRGNWRAIREIYYYKLQPRSDVAFGTFSEPQVPVCCAADLVIAADAVSAE